MMKIDYREELEPFLDQFPRHKIIDEKLIACSPFRPDSHPSFVVFLDEGNWVDSGTQERGNFYKLFAHLTGDTEENAKDVLCSKYGEIVDTDSLKLDIQINLTPSIFAFSDEALQPFKWRSPYLINRGITEKVHRAFKIGFDRGSNAVVLPWMNENGDVVKLKFRSVVQKKFWYSSDGDRIKNHLYGFNHVKKRGDKKVMVTEAETDTLYNWSNGYPSVATGTASISEAQVKLIKRSGIEELIIASDNDKAGEQFAEQLINVFGGRLKLSRIVFPVGCKDMNDFTKEQMESLETTPICVQFVNKL